MTRFRWALGAALALVALVASIQALSMYVAHGLWLGAAAVVVLAVMDVMGFFALARERLRLTRELAGLHADPPSGELIGHRRARLEAIERAGARPDLDALSLATSTSENGRAYLGRYFVAVTVLVGLVGTFAGLMETLRTVAPLLKDEGASAFQLVAAPLAGLDVTFGASVIGILVTLALSLVQGDLVLAQEEALAVLDDCTVHGLIPTLWPPSRSAGERTLEELVALRKEMAGLLSTMSESTGDKMAHAASTQLEKLAREVREALDVTVQRTTTELRDSMEKAASVAGEAMARASESAVAELSRGGSHLQKALEGAADKVSTTMGATAERVSTVMTSSADRSANALLEVHELTSDVAEKTAAALEKVASDHAAHAKNESDRIDRASQLAVERIADVTKQWMDGAAAAQVRSDEAMRKLVEEHAASMQEASGQMAVAVSSAVDRLDAVSGRSEQAVRGLADEQARAMAEAAGEVARAVSAAIAKLDAASSEAIAQMKGLAEGSRDALADSAAGYGKQVSQAMERVAATADQAVGGMTTGAELLGAAADALAGRVAAALADMAGRHREEVGRILEEVRDAARQATEQMAGGTKEVLVELARTAPALAEAQARMLEAGQDRVASLERAFAAAADQTTSCMAELASSHAEQLKETTQALLEAVTTKVDATGVQLVSASTELSTAAQTLKLGVDALTPSVNALSPELGALSREVALLAARATSDDEQTAIVDELTRLGEGMEKLQSLMRTTRGGAQG